MMAPIAIDDLLLKLRRLQEVTAAVEQADVERVRSLLEVDENGAVPVIRWPPPVGVTGLLWSAANRNHVEVVRLLLESGADVNGTDAAGNTAIMFTALDPREGDVTDRTELIALLLAAGADPNERNDAGLSPLTMAIRSSRRPGGVEVVRLLAAAGAEVNVLDRYGRTPLHWAANEGLHEVVMILLDAGADVSRRDKQGLTPAAMADLFHRTEMAATLRAREKHGFFGFRRRAP